MRKLLLLAAAAAGAAVVIKKKLDQGRHEQALWAEATDNLSSAPGGTPTPSGPAEDTAASSPTPPAE